MKTITKTFDVFNYTELNQTAKNKAVIDQINFYIEYISYENMEEFMQKAVDKMEEMKTPWFLNEVLYFDHREEMENDILLNEYLYLENGEMYNDNEEN